MDETIKIIFALVIFVSALVGALVAVFVGRAREKERYLSLGNSFAGGIFLGAGLIHLLSHAADVFDEVEAVGDFPLAFVLAGAGFALILFLERVVLYNPHAGVEGDHGHGHHSIPGAADEHCGIFPYLLAIVLSVHSIIAGIALGVEDHISAAMIIFIAIIAHKGSAAFALGCSMLRGSVPRKRAVKILVLFSIMTPLGVIAGMVAAEYLTGGSAKIVDGVFDSLAAGTFFYIAGMDVIGEEFRTPHRRWMKFALFAAGFAMMAVLAIWL